MTTKELVLFDLMESSDLTAEQLDEVEITELAENDFKVEYRSYDPFDGIIYRIHITETENEYLFDTYSSGYGDTGVVVRDKNLNFIEFRDSERA